MGDAIILNREQFNDDVKPSHLAVPIVAFSLSNSDR
jgi:hypothetical protein